MYYRLQFVVGMWASCLLVSGSTVEAGGIPLTTIRVASGLERPLFVTHAPGDLERLFIVEKTGAIKILNNGAISVFLDIDPRVGGSGTLNSEQGLFSLAFHPDYQNNNFFYVNYTNVAGNTIISRFDAIDPDTADDASEFVVMTISQPQSNHNGGWIAFGPDGFLYIATGDGGNANDNGAGHTTGTGNGQDLTINLLGKMLRIDVDGGVPFAIPPDNPFVGVTGDDEIWAYGLRNPWRNAFDSLTGDLYIADVGQGTWEEVSFQPASSTGGENYGWRCREGAHDFIISANCALETFVEPFHEYSHGGAPFRCSITGGEVYRGSAISDLAGTYFFADFCSNQIWSIRRQTDGTFGEFEDRTSELAPGGGMSIVNISSFGIGPLGEMYICDHSTGNGEVFKIVPRGIESPTLAPPPHDILKNRYISIDPRGAGGTNVGKDIDIRATLTNTQVNGVTAIDSEWWANAPDANCISIVGPSQPVVPPNWDACPTLHLTGCSIIPTSTYSIVAVDAVLVSGPPLVAATQEKPGDRWWGDTVGSFGGVSWSAPNGTVNIDDALAGIKSFQDPNAVSAVHVSVCDLEPAIPPSHPNKLCNIADVLFTILGFQGNEYSGTQIELCLDPA